MKSNIRRTLALAAGIVAPAWGLHEAPVAPVPPPAPAPAAAPFILDPGHGGEDLGAVVSGRREKDLALAISLKLKDSLERLGGSARLTRDSDITLPLDERVGQSLEGSGEAFISLHLNKVRHRHLQGIRVYAFGRDPDRTPAPRRKLAPLAPLSREEARRSWRLADALVRSLRAQGLKTAAPAPAGFYVLKHPSRPSVLIELGFLSNPEEAARLEDPAYQERLAEALAVSLEAYRLAAAASAPGPS